MIKILDSKKNNLLIKNNNERSLKQ